MRPLRLSMRSIISRNFVFRFPAGRTRGRAPTPRPFAVNASALTTKGPARFLGVVTFPTRRNNFASFVNARWRFQRFGRTSAPPDALSSGVTLRHNRSSVCVYFSFFSMDYICKKGARSIVRIENSVSFNVADAPCGARRCFYHYPNAEALALGHSRSCKSVHKKGPR